MPTTVTKVIGTSGDYTTIQAWEDALPADLVSDDSLQVGECKNQTFTENVVISGQTTDATRYIHLKCQSGASFADNASVRSNALRYNASNGMALSGNGIVLTLSTNYTRVTGLQVFHNSIYFTALKITSGATNCLVTQCILKNGPGGARCVKISDTPNVLANCLIENPGADNDAVEDMGQLYNCTIVCTGGSPTGTGLASTYNTLKAVNCAVFGFGTAYSGTAGSGSGYNASDSATTFGTNNQSSLTYADQFENSADDFRAKSTGGLHNGTPDSTNAPSDISGTDRDDTTPWIGAWEVVAVAGGQPTAKRMGGVAFTAHGGYQPATGRMQW